MVVSSRSYWIHIAEVEGEECCHPNITTVHELKVLPAKLSKTCFIFRRLFQVRLVCISSQYQQFFPLLSLCSLRRRHRQHVKRSLMLSSFFLFAFWEKWKSVWGALWGLVNQRVVWGSYCAWVLNLALINIYSLLPRPAVPEEAWHTKLSPSGICFWIYLFFC